MACYLSTPFLNKNKLERTLEEYLRINAIGLKASIFFFLRTQRSHSVIQQKSTKDLISISHSIWML